MDPIDRAIKHQVTLERLKRGTQASLEKDLAKIEKIFRDITLALDVPTLDDLSRTKLNAMLAELRRAQQAVMARTVRFLARELKGVAEYSVHYEVATLRDGVENKVKILVPKTEAALAAAYAEPIQATGALLSVLVDDWPDRQFVAASNMVRQAWAQGWSPQELAKAVGTTYGEPGALSKRLRREAHAVGHTAIQHVASQAREHVWASNADIIRKIMLLATLDGRTTPLCRSLDHTEYDVDKGPRAPLHILCRTTSVALLAPPFDTRSGKRASMNGLVSAKLSYYDWLKQQSASFQDEVLGPTRGKVFRGEGMTAKRFKDLSLDKTFQPLTLKQMKERDPDAFRNV